MKTSRRYRPSYSITLDPEVREAADNALPYKKIHSFSALVEYLLKDFLKIKP